MQDRTTPNGLQRGIAAFKSNRRVLEPRFEHRGSRLRESIDLSFRQHATDQPHALFPFNLEVVVHGVDQLIPQKLPVAQRYVHRVLRECRLRRRIRVMQPVQSVMPLASRHQDQQEHDHPAQLDGLHVLSVRRVHIHSVGDWRLRLGGRQLTYPPRPGPADPRGWRDLPTAHLGTPEKGGGSVPKNLVGDKSSLGTRNRDQRSGGPLISSRGPRFVSRRHSPLVDFWELFLVRQRRNTRGSEADLADRDFGQ